MQPLDHLSVQRDHALASIEYAVEHLVQVLEREEWKRPEFNQKLAVT